MDTNNFSLVAAKATRLAFKTNKPEDHQAAIAAHTKARGGEFEPQITRGSNFQPNIDKWKHHDKQIKMHQAALESMNESSQ
jgi:hypothetical protein